MTVWPGNFRIADICGHSCVAKEPKEPVSEVQAHNYIRIMSELKDRIMLYMSIITQIKGVLMTILVLINTSETGSKGAWRCQVEPEFLFPERFSVINYHVASVALLDLCTSHGMLSRTSAKSRELIQQFTPRLHESRRHSRESGTQESFADGNVLYLSGYGFPPARE